MRKHYKKIMAGLMAAAMIVPTTVAFIEPVTASAQEILGESEFSHKMLPWHTCEASPARQYFELEDGTVHIRILVPTGAEMCPWDLQFRHRNLNFQKGHEYKVSFKVKSARDGMELFSNIGNLNGTEQYFVLDGRDSENVMHMGPHMGGQWGNLVKLSTDWTEFKGTFIPTEDIEGAEWSFWYANDNNGYGGNAIEGDELWFDDMHIDDVTDEAVPPNTSSYGYTSRQYSGIENNFISVNQLGYYSNLSKIATLGDNYGDVTYGADLIKLNGRYDAEIVNNRYNFEIVDTKDDTVVHKGKTSPLTKDNDSGDTVCKIDFSDFKTPGEYYIRIKGQKWRSMPFKISDDIYSEKDHDLLTNALNYFYQNRSGVKIEEKYITSGEKSKLAHDYDRNESAGFVQKEWHNRNYLTNDYTQKQSSSKLDIRGGWFDGEFADRSMTEGGISVWTLQNMYERALKSTAAAKKFKDGSGVAVIPENGNDIPDILDECKYELDFMQKMKVQPNEKTWGEYAGMYYHMTQGIGLSPNRPDYEHEYHSLCAVDPPTFAATLNYAACAAQAARLWLPYDKEYAVELLTSAKEAYEAYKKYYYAAAPNEENNAQSAYAPYFTLDADSEVLDDAYWAACELFITASEMNDKDADSYYKELSESKDAFWAGTRIKGGDNDKNEGSFTVFNSGNTAAAGSLSLLLHKELLDGEQKKTLEDNVVAAAADILDKENKQGYGIPYIYDSVPYYDNSGIFEPSYTGFEYFSNERAVNNMIAMAYAYDITGDDQFLNGVAGGMDYLLGNNPLSFSYITGYGDYSVKNPVHHFWQNELDKSLPQAPDGVLVSGPTAKCIDQYIAAMGFKAGNIDTPSERLYADSVESWSTNNSSLSTNASLAWVVSFIQDAVSEQSALSDVKGDADCDGKSDIADAVVLQKWLLNDSKFTFKNWKNIDMNGDGMIDVFDLIMLKKELIK